MQVEIITIGDEILIGQIVDTNSAWMSAALNDAGFDVLKISSIHDDEHQIVDSLQTALQEVDVVLITGGIGPTNDDITKQTLSKFFGAKLIFYEQVYAHIEQLLTYRKRAMNALTKMQAMVPDNATIIPNHFGTAPVTWFEQDGKVVVSMPGVPYEMKKLMQEEIVPRLQKHFQTQTIIHQTVLVQGYPESALALKIADWENNLPQEIRLAYLPQFNIVRLRMSVIAQNRDENKWKEEIARQLAQLKTLLGHAIIAEADLSLEEIIGNTLKLQAKTMATAESCTGGGIAKLITSVAGSSEYFKGSIVAYSNEMKTKLLQIDKEFLKEYGAVSEQVAIQMASRARALMDTDYAVATTGVAGPSGGSPNNPVGTVWVAVATNNDVYSEKYYFAFDRNLNIERAGQAALLFLLKIIKRDYSRR